MHLGVSLLLSVPHAHKAPFRGAVSRLGMSLGPGLTSGSIVQRMFDLGQVFHLNTSIFSSVKRV